MYIVVPLESPVLGMEVLLKKFHCDWALKILDNLTSCSFGFFFFALALDYNSRAHSLLLKTTSAFLYVWIPVQLPFVFVGLGCSLFFFFVYCSQMSEALAFRQTRWNCCVERKPQRADTLPMLTARQPTHEFYLGYYTRNF